MYTRIRRVVGVLCLTLILVSVMTWVEVKQAEAVIPPLLIAFGTYLFQALMVGAALGGGAVLGQYAIPAIVDKIEHAIESMTSTTRMQFSTLAGLWETGQRMFGMSELVQAGLGHIGAFSIITDDVLETDISPDTYSFVGVTKDGYTIPLDLSGFDYSSFLGLLSDRMVVSYEGTNLLGFSIETLGYVPCFYRSSYQYIRHGPASGYNSGSVLSQYRLRVMNRFTGVTDQQDFCVIKDNVNIDFYWGNHLTPFLEETGYYYELGSVSSNPTVGIISLLDDVGFTSVSFPNSGAAAVLRSDSNWGFVGDITYISNMTMVNTDQVMMPSSITIPAPEDDPPTGVVPLVPEWWDTLNPDATLETTVDLEIDQEQTTDPLIDPPIPPGSVIDWSKLLGMFDGVSTKFPFSIPWDIQRGMTALVGTPVRPHITARLAGYQIDWEWPEWLDGPVAWLRRLELLAFGVGVALRARTLASPTGGTD